MNTKNSKSVVFAGLFAISMLSLAGLQSADASIATPVFDGLSTGLKVSWSGIVDHDVRQYESSQKKNICGETFTMSGFYDTKYNKRGASHQIPSNINGLCNIDADLSGYVNLTLDKVVYKLQGDGNTSINQNMGHASSNYKFWNNAYSNSGNEYITVIAYYKHTS